MGWKTEGGADKVSARKPTKILESLMRREPGQPEAIRRDPRTIPEPRAESYGIVDDTYDSTETLRRFANLRRGEGTAFGVSCPSLMTAASDDGTRNVGIVFRRKCPTITGHRGYY